MVSVSTVYKFAHIYDFQCFALSLPLTFLYFLFCNFFFLFFFFSPDIYDQGHEMETAHNALGDVTGLKKILSHEGVAKHFVEFANILQEPV
jgi:hypothetical protein